MKKITLTLLTLYKGPVYILLKSLGITTTCRFSPSCSVFMLEMVKQHGVLRGIKMGLIQLKSCHPLGEVYGTSI